MDSEYELVTPAWSFARPPRWAWIILAFLSVANLVMWGWTMYDAFSETAAGGASSTSSSSAPTTPEIIAIIGLLVLSLAIIPAFTVAWTPRFYAIAGLMQSGAPAIAAGFCNLRFPHASGISDNWIGVGVLSGLSAVIVTIPISIARFAIVHSRKKRLEQSRLLASALTANPAQEGVWPPPPSI